MTQLLQPVECAVLVERLAGFFFSFPCSFPPTCELCSVCVCVHANRLFMLFEFLQYPGELYIAPDGVCNSIRIVLQGHGAL